MRKFRSVRPKLSATIVPFYIIAFMTGVGCLKLQRPATSDLPALIALMSGSESFYLFPDESDAGGQSNGMLRADPEGSALNVSWVPFTGGPANTWKAEVLNGTIFVLQEDSEDELWISRNQGTSWETFEAPEDNEDEDISHILGCGDALILTYDTISQDPDGDHPAYVSYDNGRSFQTWFVSGTGEVTVDGIDCNDSYLYIAFASQNHIQYAPVQDLSSFTLASSHSSIYDQYYGLIAGTSGIIGMADQNGDYYSNYGSGLPQDMQTAGSYPVAYTFYPLSASRHSGADYISGTYKIGMVDTGNDICRIYSLDTFDTAPTSGSYVEPGCNQVSDLGNLPDLAGDESTILASYRNDSGTNGAVLFSTDGGNSFSHPSIDEWTDAGFISDIEVD